MNRNNNHFDFFDAYGSIKLRSCKKYRYSDLVFACGLAVIFAVLVPVTEWPDSVDHIMRRLDSQTIYPFKCFFEYFDYSVPESRGEHIFFADHYIFQPNLSHFFMNAGQLLVALVFIFSLFLLAAKVGGGLTLFCPPLIFSMIAPSQEVIAIFLLVSALLTIVKLPGISLVLAVLSAAVDRSMAPNAAFIVLYLLIPSFRLLVSNFRWMLIAGVFVVFVLNLTSPADLVAQVDDDLGLVFGLTIHDIRYNSQYGGQNILALAASTMGLFGWMSIRPFPFWIYYPLIISLFIIGFSVIPSENKGIFTALLLVSFFVMWLFPPLSQARYYPLLSMAFWSIVVSGARIIKINRHFLYLFVSSSVAAGCVFSIFNNW